MVATETGQIERYQWDGRIELEHCLELSQILFSSDQQYSRGTLICIRFFNSQCSVITHIF